MKTGRPEDVLGRLRPGQRVYVQGGPAECAAFSDLLQTNPGAARGVELWSCLIPGNNTFDYGSLPDGPKLVTFMASPALERSIASEQTRVDVMPYSEIAVRLAQTDFDIAILHSAPPDGNGRCSFGIGCEAPGIVWPRAKDRIVFLTQKMPAIRRSPSIVLKDVDLAIPIDWPLLSPARTKAGSSVLEAIARRAAELVPDGAVIQSGIGEAPGAVVAALKDRRRLRFHSGMVTPEYRLLDEAGAFEAGGDNVAGIAWGGPDFYQWLASSDIARFCSALVTHNRQTIGGMSNFASIGSAIEVDLKGNLNLEWVGSRRVSSIGGAPDYVAAANASLGGRSIIALPSTAASGASRIVQQLPPHAISIPGDLADAIVTEHGVAQLRGLSPEARARSLIDIAAAQHRAALAGPPPKGRHGIGEIAGS